MLMIVNTVTGMIMWSSRSIGDPGWILGSHSAMV
jgi:hypothetical protein